MEIRLSEAEWDVMEVLWSADRPLTATDIDETLRKGSRSWSLATVKSLLSRLLAKQAATPERDGRRFFYSPAMARQSCVSNEARRFVNRLFDGRLSPLIAQLAEDETLGEQDIAEIEALLARLKS